MESPGKHSAGGPLSRATRVLRGAAAVALAYAGLWLVSEIIWSCYAPSDAYALGSASSECGPRYGAEVRRGDLIVERNVSYRQVPTRDWTVVGYGFSSGTCIGGHGHYRLTLPGWLAALSLMAYPVHLLVVAPLRGWRRARRGHCPGCGYCLTGNVSNVCPECGRPGANGPGTSGAAH
jgi:hypothetical protein